MVKEILKLIQDDGADAERKYTVILNTNSRHAELVSASQEKTLIKLNN